MTRVANWGNYPSVEAEVRTFADESELRARLAGARSAIPRGLGRSYGDSSLASIILSSERLNRMLEFDDRTGTLTSESGVSLAEILDVFVPRGWFLPVTPGTKFVTVGGAIAADVHGKNHHKEGSFGDHVLSMDVMTPAGDVVRCSPVENPELFEATCGGMGLTGVILRATFRLKRIESSFIREEIVAAENLDAIMRLFEESAGWTYTVAWIDCLARGARMGRSILMRGEHATAAEARDSGHEPFVPPKPPRLAVPFMLPAVLLNSLTVRAFNAVYFSENARRAGRRVLHYDPFFYPLDGIRHWNRMYGRRGFTQYQMAFPKETSRAGLRALLERISASGQGSFLAVLKLFGRGNRLLSFPREGYTLALDFPITPRVLALLDELDAITLDHGGRIYLAKDARVRPDVFAKGYERLSEFKARVARWNPDGALRSLQSQRLELNP